MGNILAAVQITNNSDRAVRVYVTEKEEELDTFVNAEPEPAGVVTGSPKKSTFVKGVKFIRVLASNTKDVPMEMKRYVSIFVEDDEDQNVPCKKIVLNLAVTLPVSLLIYDV